MADEAVLRSDVAGYYARYRNVDPGKADWERPIYTARTAALIASWRSAEESVSAENLESFGWLCECQDWNAEQFRATIVSVDQTAPGSARVRLTINAGWDSEVEQVLQLRQEGGRWLIDDLSSASMVDGLRHTLEGAVQ